MENAIETEKLVYSSMKTHLNIPVYVTLGNHDTYPYAQIAQEKSGFVNRFSWNTDLAYDMWTDSNWMTEKEAANVKEHYAGFAVTNKRDFGLFLSMPTCGSLRTTTTTGKLAKIPILLDFSDF